MRKDATTSFRACTLCAATRVRCSGGNPCQRCLKKGTGCTYPAYRKRKTTSREQGKNCGSRKFTSGVNQTTGVPERSLDHSHMVNSPANQEAMHAPQENFQTSHSNEQIPGADSAILNPRWHPERTDSTSRTDQFQESQSPIIDQRELINYLCYDPSLEQGFNGQSFPSINWLSPSNDVYEDWNTQFTSFTGPIGFEASNSLATDNTALFHQPLNAWDSEVAAQMSIIPLGVSLDNPPNSSSPHYNQSTATPGASVVGSSGSETTSRFYVDGTGARTSLQQLRKKRELASRRPVDFNSPSHIISGLNHHATLQADLEAQMAISNCWVPSDLYNELLQNIRKLDQSTVGLTSFPSLEYLNMFCQLYFENFHPGFPFIRKQLFGTEKDDWLLALAVAATGVCYSNMNIPEIVAFKQVLHSSLRTTLCDINNTNKGSGYVCVTTPYTTLPRGDRIIFIQSRILNVLLMIHSGDATLMSNGYSEFSALVITCNRMHLLSAIDKDQLNSQIRESKWLQIELRIRTGYMIWVSINHTLLRVNV